MASDDRRRAIDLRSADRFGHVVPLDEDSWTEGELRPTGERRDASFVVQIEAIVLRVPGDRPVHRARIDMAQAEMARDRPRDGAFAGARRAVDRDYQSPPAHRCSS